MSPSVRFRAVAAIVVLGAAALFAGRAARTGGGAGIPVVLITVDTLRADRVGAYGRPGGRTPALDSLAAEGALFEDASAPCPLTLPSHASILTGLLPPRHGLRDNLAPRPLAGPKARGFATLAEMLRDAGYETAAFVSAAPLSPRWGLDQGFGTYDAPPDGDPGEMSLSERDGAETVDRALDWLRRRDRGRPFLLWVHLFDPHHPYRAPGSSGALPDSPEAYEEEVAHADAQVGRLLRALREDGALDRAVVVACADHGEGLGEHGEATHGYFLHRSTLRVPLLVRSPARVKPGTRRRDPVSLVDVLPTILDLAGRPVPRLVDGRPLFHADGALPAPSAAASGQYAETLYGWLAFGWAQAVALRDGPLRAIDHGGGRRHVFDLDADAGEEKPLPPERGAALSEAAWALFRSPPLLAAAPADGPAPELSGIPYLTGHREPRTLDDARNAACPLPSAPFLRRFEAQMRVLDRIRADPDGDPKRVDEVLAELAALDREDPGNPAIAFWEGRALRLKARILGPSYPESWRNAFFKFQEAGRRGYDDPRTVTLMLEALHHGGKFPEMRRVSEAAVKQGMDGDYAFWCWVALGWFQGRPEPAAPPAAADRAAVDSFLDRAEKRCRTDRDREHVKEVRAVLR